MLPKKAGEAGACEPLSGVASRSRGRELLPGWEKELLPGWEKVLPRLENAAGHHISHHQFTPCPGCLAILSQTETKLKCPSGNAQITMLRARLPFIPNYLMMWKWWSTAALPQAPSDPRTPGPEKSLEDCNHKWITSDTRVPDGGKEISICTNEGETLMSCVPIH